MTYTAVPAKSTGDLLAASDWGTYVKDNLADHEARISANSYSGCLLMRTTNQSIPSATDTLVSWNTETVDQGGWFPSTGTTVTVPAGALPSGFTTILVSISWAVPFAANATGARKVEIWKNAALYRTEYYNGALDASALAISATGPDIPCVPGDTFALNVSQSSGGALNLSGATLNLSMSVRRVNYY